MLFPFRTRERRTENSLSGQEGLVPGGRVTHRAIAASRSSALQPILLIGQALQDLASVLSICFRIFLSLKNLQIRSLAISSKPQ